MCDFTIFKLAGGTMSNRITLIWAHHGKMSAGQKIQPHTHTCHQAYYILSGNPCFIIDDQPVHIKSGSFFVIPAGVRHQTDTFDQDGLESYDFKIILNDPFLLEHLRTFLSPLENCHAMQQALHHIIKYWNYLDPQISDDIDYLLSSLLLQLFLPNIHYKDPGSRYIQTERYNATTRAILSYIDNNSAGKLSMEEMGRTLGYHKNYLSTTFSKNTGFSIIDYLNFVRIRRAIHCFAFYGQDVFTAYESTGFSSLSYFSRTFKSMVGVSPRDFRQAFLSVTPDTEKSFQNEPILNYQPCTIEDIFRSMQALGKLALSYSDAKHCSPSSLHRDSL